MPLSEESGPEGSSTYFVTDRSNLDELERLRIQDQMATQSMGGVLPEQTDLARFQRVLDVGCGTGGWLIELAKSLPTCTLLIGVDASHTYVEYARQQAEAEHVSDRVEFHVADALRMLEFPTGFFDLVNHRFALGWVRTWEWSKLLGEYQRVCHPGGTVRITEPAWGPESNSLALTHLAELSLQASYHAGNLFHATSDGLIRELPALLKQHGLQDVQTRANSVPYRAGTPEGQAFIEDMTLLFRTIRPFLQKWTRVPDDYEELYQQMLNEMQQPAFAATASGITAWGTKPSV